MGVLIINTRVSGIKCGRGRRWSESPENRTRTERREMDLVNSRAGEIEDKSSGTSLGAKTDTKSKVLDLIVMLADYSKALLYRPWRFLN